MKREGYQKIEKKSEKKAQRLEVGEISQLSIHS